MSTANVVSMAFRFPALVRSFSAPVKAASSTAASVAARPAASLFARRPLVAAFSTSSASRRTDSDQTNSSASSSNAPEQTPSEGSNEPSATTTLEAGHAAAIAAKDTKISELQDSYVRCLADMENLRTRTRNEVDSARQFAIQKFAKDLLETVDVMRMALGSIPAQALDSNAELAATEVRTHLQSLHQGVTMTETELLKALKRHGVERFEPLDEPFDPNLHEALFQAPMPGKQAGTVFSVQKTGFKLNGRVIRPAQVGVVKGE